MISLSKITDPDMMSEARTWVTDALGVHGRYYQESDVIKMVDRWYEGGIPSFLVNATPLIPQYATGQPIPGAFIGGPVVKVTTDTVIIHVDTVNGRLTSSTYVPHLSGAEVHLPRRTAEIIYGTAK